MEVKDSFWTLWDNVGRPSAYTPDEVEMLIVAYPASLRRILLLDIALFLLQTIALVVGFITNHGSNIPSSTQFPFVDLLLPPTDIDVGVGLSGEDPVDLESGTMRHRKGKRGVDEDEDDNVVWLSEDYLEPGSSASELHRSCPATQS